MRLAHFADIHLDERDPRFGTMVGVIGNGFADAVSKGAEIILIAGDLTGRDTSHRYTIQERLMWVDLLVEAAKHVPVIAIRGNHDRVGELEIFKKLKTQRRIVVSDARPPHGEIVFDGGALLSATCIPYMRKREICGTQRDGLGTTDDNLACSLTLAERMFQEGIDLQKDGPSVCICITHNPVAGAKMGTFEVQSSQDVCLTSDQLNQMPFDYVALGHIHQRQQVADKAHYCGSPYPLTYGESGPKGYLLVDVIPGEKPEVHFQELLSWKMETIEIDWCDAKTWCPKDDLKHSHVRVKIAMPRGVHAPLGVLAEIEAKLTKAGALSVKIQQDTEGVLETRNVKIVQAESDEVALRELLQNEELEQYAINRILKKFEVLKVWV